MSDSRIWSRVLGQGPRRALALHCTIAHSGAWRGVAAALDDKVTMTCPDMLCHGKSADWDGEGDFPDLMFEGLEPYLEPGLDLIGHSFGGILALRLAETHPDLVRSLTLIEPVAFGIIREDEPDLFSTQSNDASGSAAAMAARDWPLAARLFNRRWGDGITRWDDLPEASRNAMIRGIRIVPSCAGPVLYDTSGLYRPGVLESLEIPVLLVRGEQSEPAMAAALNALERRLPDARQVVVEGAGHMVPITHPIETAKAIRALWALEG